MSAIRKSIDAGLTNAERKKLRESEAREAMSDHDDAEKAFHENRERLREARLAREAAAGPILYPAPGLPDETPIDNVRFSARITNALNSAGVKTVGEIRQASDATLLSFQDLGASSIARLRETLGPAPSRVIKPTGKKPYLNTDYCHPMRTPMKLCLSCSTDRSRQPGSKLQHPRCGRTPPPPEQSRS